MLITLTTAKYGTSMAVNPLNCLLHVYSHPDVFMESYYENSVTPLFFMVYMFITFYYFSNVVSTCTYP